MTHFDYDAERRFYSDPIVTVGPYQQSDADLKTWVPGYPSVFEGKAILDIGAGEAYITLWIAEACRPRRVIGLELIEHRLQAARTKLRELPALSLVVGDCYQLPYSKETFDIVIGNGVLHHLPEMGRVAQEIRRVLKRNGMYVGREPNFGNPIAKSRVLGEHRTENEHMITRGEILDAFSGAGFDADVRFFWRRMPWLNHPVLGFGMRVHARAR